MKNKMTTEEKRIARNNKQREYIAKLPEDQRLWLLFYNYMHNALKKRFSTSKELKAMKQIIRQRNKKYYNSSKGKAYNHPSTKEAWALKIVGPLKGRHNKLIKDEKISKDSKFDLTPKFILKLLNKQNLRCIETDTKFTFGTAKCPFKPSIDRIDNNKGYEKKNSRIVTVQANISRRDYTIDQHQENFVRAAEVLKRNEPEKYKMLVSRIESK